MKFHPNSAQTTNPGTQQRGRLLAARENAAARPNVRFHLQLARPRTKFVRTKFIQQIAPSLGFGSIAGGEILYRLTVSQVQTPSPGDEKLPSGRALRLADVDPGAGSRSDFRGPQAGWSCTNNEDSVFRVDQLVRAALQN